MNRRAALRALLAAAVALFACAGAALLSARLCPTRWVDVSLFVRPDDGLVVVDRHGRALRHVRVDGADRRWVPLNAVDRNLVAAVLAAEDSRFRSHGGVDALATLRAALQNLTPGRPRSGASTLTQQLLKRVYGRPHGLFSKLSELFRAVALEQLFSKDEVLEQYLNRLPFPAGVEGVARASEELLGHDVGSLTPAEAALLAGIPQAPSNLDPRRHPEAALARRNYVLARMRIEGALSEQGYREALAAPLLPGARPLHPWHAARFTDLAVRAWSRGEARRQGSLLRTTLDLDLQHDAEELLRTGLAGFEARGARNAAGMVLSNSTGEVLAYVGAAQETPTRAGASLDLLSARRTPGSTLKPLAYALWFERGASPASVVDDVRRPLLGAQGASIELRNYDGAEHGPVSARTALASSYNLAALEVARQVSPDAMLERLRALGVRDLADASHYGPALVLGGSALSAWDLARLYLALARDGSAVEPSLFPRGPTAGRALFRPDAARLVTDILRDPEPRRAAFGASLVELYGGEPRFALKTGTSQGWRDAWAAAYDERFTALVWMGDPSGSPMAQVSGFQAAAPLAVGLLARARRLDAADAPTSAACSVCHLAQLETAEVCDWSGLRPGPRCTHRHREHFAHGAAPTAPCEQHDAQGRDLVPARLREWAERSQRQQVAVRETQDTATGVLRVVFPSPNARWLVPEGTEPPELTLRAAVGTQAVAAQWTVDGVALPSDRWRSTPGTHRIQARWSGRSAEELTVEVRRGGR